MSDWDKRELCPDGGCVGVIRADGTCSVCGRAAPNWGDERNRGKLVTSDDESDVEDDADEAEDDGDETDDDSDGGDDAGDDHGDDGDIDAADEEEDEDEDEGDAEGDEDGAISASSEWSARKLCPDGGCVGVIGTDGSCKVCGRSAA